MIIKQPIFPDHCSRIEYSDEDIFDNPDSKAHCVPADLQMAFGVAKLFRARYGNIQFLFHQRCHTGAVALLTPVQTGVAGEYIFYLVTKTRYFDKPTFPDARQTMRAFVNMALKYDVQRVHIPLLCTGWDDMAWPETYHFLAETLLEIDKNELLKIIVHRQDENYYNHSVTIRLPLKTIQHNQTHNPNQQNIDDKEDQSNTKEINTALTLLSIEC